MSYRPQHEFVDGANILGAQMASCAHCQTLRVTNPSRHPQPRYIIRVNDPLLRDGFDAPPCIAPVESKGARERVDAMGRARAREQALREAKLAAPARTRGAAVSRRDDGRPQCMSAYHGKCGSMSEA